MTTPQREAFGGGHESAHWSPHLWDRFRSTRAHVDRMWRAFGMSGRTTTAAAEPPPIEHSNPETVAEADREARGRDADQDYLASVQEELEAAEAALLESPADPDAQTWLEEARSALDAGERAQTERERRIAELGDAREQGELDEVARDAEAARVRAEWGRAERLTAEPRSEREASG